MRDWGGPVNSEPDESLPLGDPTTGTTFHAQCVTEIGQPLVPFPFTPPDVSTLRSATARWFTLNLMRIYSAYSSLFKFKT